MTTNDQTQHPINDAAHRDYSCGGSCKQHNEPLFRYVDDNGKKGTVRGCGSGCVYDLREDKQIYAM